VMRLLGKAMVWGVLDFIDREDGEGSQLGGMEACDRAVYSKNDNGSCS
jgi:hypothetical protein